MGFEEGEFLGWWGGEFGEGFVGGSVGLEGLWVQQST